MSRLGTIQVLRALAALMVALGHLQHEALNFPAAAQRGFSPVFLGLSGVGVDLFFVISGFVMVFGSRKLFGEPGAAATFMARRVARIVPLYWLMTSLFVAALLLSPGALTTKLPDIAEIAKSYLFVPYQPAAGGVVQPVYKLGWTLNYEMFFYLCFALTLAFRPRVAVFSIAAIFLVLAMLGQMITPLPAIFRFWSDPIILEFVFGALVGLAYCEGRRIAPLLGSLLMVAGLVLLLAGDWLGLSPTGALRPLVWGLPAALVLIGAALGQQKESLGQQVENSAPAPTFMERLGDASYALYLLHPLVIRGLRMVWDRAGFSANLDPWIFVGLGTLILIPASLFVYRFIEKPITQRAQRRLVGTAKPANTPIQIRMAAILGKQA